MSVFSEDHKWDKIINKLKKESIKRKNLIMEIAKLIDNNPNDSELGKAIRKLYNDVE
jgi:hypothetical protein